MHFLHQIRVVELVSSAGLCVVVGAIFLILQLITYIDYQLDCLPSSNSTFLLHFVKIRLTDIQCIYVVIFLIRSRATSIKKTWLHRRTFTSRCLWGEAKKMRMINYVLVINELHTDSQ